jgi:outer membrane cobalamin receptor
MQSVPGIQSFGDGSALYFVRGGNYDQNLLLIDEVPIYNPSHLFGFYSAIAPDAINDVQIYKGDFPARYGGRLSSIVDVKAREGNLKRFGFSGNIGPYASNLTVEGPIVKDRGSFLLSGRVSTVNWINYLTEGNRSFDFMFFDINAKLNYRINDNNRIFFTFYTGRDDFSRLTPSSVKTFGISWDNLAATLRWNHIFSSRLFSNTTVNYSRYNYYLFLSQQQDDFWGSSVSNLTAKTDFAWYLSPSNTIRMGAEVTSHRSNPGNVTVEGKSGMPPAPEVPEYRSLEYVVYAGNEQRIGKKVSVRYGIRLPVWQDLGPTTVYYFDVNHQVIDTTQVASGKGYATFFSPEPRLNIQVALDGKSAVKASYSRTTQFIQILSNSVSPFTSLEVWVPAGPNIEPQKADQVALGYFRQVAKPNLNLSVEAFYKRFYNHIDYADHANLLYNPLLEGEVRAGDAWSYGLEVMLRKNTGKLTGWIGYTWSRAMIRTPEVNGGEAYPATWDRPHDVCVNVAYDTKKRWAFAANWILMTGGAITTPIGFYYNNGYSVPIYGDRNNDRLPSYHRLDLSMSYAFSRPDRRYRHKLIVTLYNAYGRLNPFSVSFNKIMNDNGDFVVPSNLDGGYELVPTSISVAGIIPSINYQFRF